MGELLAPSDDVMGELLVERAARDSRLVRTGNLIGMLFPALCLLHHVLLNGRNAS